MKKAINPFIIALLLIVGCTQEDRLVKVSQDAIDKSVMITVNYKDFDRTIKIGGSGVFVTPDGYILTCKHLFTLPEQFDATITIDSIFIEMSNDQVVSARLICLSGKFDLALLQAKTTKPVKYATLADPRKLQIGQEVIAVGGPLGMSFTVTSGIISQLYRDFDGFYNVTQSDTAINPGNSGGPLFNLKGELVGINSFMLTVLPRLPLFTGLGFSVQSGQCLEFLVKSNNKISPHRRYKWLRLLNQLKK